MIRIHGTSVQRSMPQTHPVPINDQPLTKPSQQTKVQMVRKFLEDTKPAMSAEDQVFYDQYFEVIVNCLKDDDDVEFEGFDSYLEAMIESYVNDDNPLQKQIVRMAVNYAFLDKFNTCPDFENSM